MIATVQIAYILSHLDNLVTCTPSMQILPSPFPGSPLTPAKNKNGGGEPGINLHVILQHDFVTTTSFLFVLLEIYDVAVIVFRMPAFSTNQLTFIFQSGTW